MPPMPSSGEDDVAVLGMEGADLGRVTRDQRGRDEGGAPESPASRGARARPNLGLVEDAGAFTLGLAQEVVA